MVPGRARRGAGQRASGRATCSATVAAAAASVPPNDWQSMFGGAAWTRVTEPDGEPGQWYLHLFDTEQPDLDWTNPEVRAEFESILRFWLDRGVDGFRIDVAHGLAKDPALPDVGTAPRRRPGTGPAGHPHWDQDEVHDVYRRWRRLSDGYDGERAFVGEAWVATPERLARYVRPDELHTAFNFDFLLARGTPARCARPSTAASSALARGRRAADLGAVEPRRHPPRHPVRRRRRWACAGPGPPRC